ncbi:MAG: T9SS C-terminal target domain-containing protein [Porphyromonadaceae bacterium]|nr:MAG: T9SS C-terminal target domain-containing protein [Porphyromonadaceae bacterium]
MEPARAIRKYSLLFVCGFLIIGNLGAQKLLDSIVTYYYQPGGDSVNGVRIADEYNGAGQRTSHSIYLWDMNTRRWDGWMFPVEECAVCPGRYEYGYDEKGNQVSSGGFVWWGHTVGWVERTRTESGYDDCGNRVSSTFSSWSTEEKEWIPGIGQEFGYDDAGRTTSSIAYVWDPTLKTWHPIEKMIYSFEDNGRKTQELRQQWDEAVRDWVNLTKTEWYYDSLEITTEYASFRWTLTGKNYDWKEDNRHKIEHVFDTAGNRILTTDFLKTSATRWTAIYKEDLKYNQIDKPVLSVISKGTGGLTEYLRTEWVYDPDGRLVLETLTGWMQRRPGLMGKKKSWVIRSFDTDGDLAREIWYYWDGEAKSYLLDGKDYYFYHSTATSHQEIRMDPIRVYPNPTGGILNLSGLSQPAEVKIYSMQGMLLRSVHHVEFSFDISGLSPGAYLILVAEVNHPPFRTILIKE